MNRKRIWLILAAVLFVFVARSVSEAADPKMYWTQDGKILRGNPDGTNVETLVTGRNPEHLVLDVTGGKMYWRDYSSQNKQYSILSANLDGTKVKILIAGLSRYRGNIALDIGNGKLYWTDSGTNKIQRANLDGSGVLDLVDSDLSDPYGIALDVAAGKMYWTDFGNRKIQRANLNGSDVETLIDFDLHYPYGIALDVTTRKMYWTDSGTDRIQRANLDGSDIEILPVDGLSDPHGIALDVENSKLYWTDSGTDKIQRANLDGSDIEILPVDGLSDPHGIALDVENSKLYWTDSGNGKIQRANLDGTSAHNLFTGLNNVRGIALVPSAPLLTVPAVNVSPTTDPTVSVTSPTNPVVSTTLIDTTDPRYGLEIPDNMVWLPAQNELSTYFFFGARVSSLTGAPPGADVEYEECEIKLHIPDESIYFILPVTTQTGRRIKAGADIGTAIINVLGALNIPKVSQAAGIAGAIIAVTDAWDSTVKAFADDLRIKLPNNLLKKPEASMPFIVMTIPRMDSVSVTVKQVVKINGGESQTLTANGLWDLSKDVLAAPIAQPSALTDWSPFQLLSPHAQQGLLQLSELVNSLTRSTSATRETQPVPEKTSLLANYPNPFNPETWIPYQLSKAADVTLTLYDIQGRVVRHLDLGHQRAGMYHSRNRAAYWDGRNAQGEPVASGVYFYTLKTGDFTATRKMLIRK